jgi:hypothetical protein
MGPTVVALTSIAVLGLGSTVGVLSTRMLAASEKYIGDIVISVLLYVAAIFFMLVGFWGLSFADNGFNTSTEHNVTVSTKYKDMSDTLVANGWNCTAVITGGWVCSNTLTR